MKPFFQVIRNYWVDLILLNLAFLLGCIPIVTIPASMVALCSAVLRMQREQTVHIFHDFFLDIKSGFLRSLPTGCSLLAGFAFFLGGWYALTESDFGQGRFVTLTLLLLWLYLIFAFEMYALPLAAQTALPHCAVFRNAFILTLARGWQNAAALLLVGLCTAVLVLTFPFLLPLLLLVHFSLCALICMSFAATGLRQCFTE